eukprot:TRINITY_DN3388_c0_g1_i1.p1 TRINITY_DN3388_c0_g1~~TRINITY_DN3388_c0_g1_i1.p1  ORF type:complete len:414 (+),score=121.37 TRINITY_DN3388_c0_g1_i1:96-1337(+)
MPSKKFAVAKAKSSLPRKRRNVRKQEEKVDTTITDTTIDRKSIAVETLVSGYVQSFVDLFYLTHRANPHYDPLVSTEQTEIEVSPQDLLFMQNALVEAEKARRSGKPDEVFRNYESLASYFEATDDHKTAIYFHEKCLEISRLTNDNVGEMRAHQRIGLSHEKLKDFGEAIAHHLIHVEIATKLEDTNEQMSAHVALVRVYRAQSEVSPPIEALELLQKCLEAAATAGLRAEEADAHYQLGETLRALDRKDDASDHYQSHLSICRGLGDFAGETKACARLALLKEGDADGVEFLEQQMEAARELGDLTAQANACSSLGRLSSERKAYDESAKHYERSFEMLKSSMRSRRVLKQNGNTSQNNTETPSGLKALEDARVRLGVARGSAKLASYLEIVNGDITALLRWKNRRVNFKS